MTVLEFLQADPERTMHVSVRVQLKCNRDTRKLDVDFLMRKTAASKKIQPKRVIK